MIRHKPNGADARSPVLRHSLGHMAYVRIAAETLLALRTVQRAYETGRTTPANARLIASTAKNLGLPPPASSESAEASR